MNKRIVRVSSILILVVLSIFMMFQYDGIKANIEKDNQEALIRDLIYEFPGVEYSLLFEATNKKNFFDTYFELKEIDESVGIDGTWVKNSIIKLFDDVKNTVNFKQNFYYSVNIKGNPYVYTNTSKKLEKLASDNNLKKDFHAYILIHFDENGELSVDGDLKNYNYQKEMLAKEIGSIDGISRIAYNSGYIGEFGYLDSEVISEVMQLKSIKNTTITIAIPKYYMTNNRYYGYGISNLTYDFIGGLLPYFGMGVLVLAVFIFVAPLAILEESYLYRYTKKIKLELLLIVFAVLGVILFLLAPMIAGISAYQIAIDGFLRVVTNDFLTKVINILIWCISFQWAALVLFMMKYIMINGFSYFKANTLISWLIGKIIKFINKVITFDLNKDSNRKILVFVLMNFIGIIISSTIPFLGCVIAIVYSIMLFILIERKIKVESKNYLQLLDATKKLSSGNFDVELKENLGQFQTLGDEFARIKDGFQSAVDEEVKSQRMKSELISNVSHDLKTPLTTIITYVDLLKAEKLKEQEKDYVNILDSSAQRLKRLIDDLFEVSKANSGDIQLNMEEVDVVSLLKQVHFENLNSIDKKSLEFKIQTSSDRILVNLDSMKMYRIFDNLIINIYKYALSNTRVYIDVCEDEQQVTITFKNISENEIAMDASELSKRFVQGDVSRNQAGSGLGLAIVKSFTSIQGGEMNISVDGDLFKVELKFIK